MDRSHFLRRTLNPAALLAMVLLVILAPPRAFSQVPPPAPVPPPPAPAQPAGDDTPSVALQFPNNQINEILVVYEELTKKKIIKDINVLGATVSVETTGLLTRKDAIEFIEKTLLLNGYAFVPAGENIVKIISFGGGKQPRGEGVPIYSRTEDLPDTEQVVSYFMSLDYITTEEAVRTFTQVIPNHVYGVIVPVPSASAVIISENSAVIRSLVELKEFVDVPPAQVLNKSIQLERSDAEEVAGIIKELLGAQQEASGGGAARGVAQVRTQPVATATPGAAPGAAPQISLAIAGGGGGASTSESIQPQIVPIVRTNRLLVIARPVDMAYIESLVSEFDAPAEIRNFLKRKLAYLRVVDFLQIASDALSRGQEEGAGGVGGALGTTAGRTTTTRQTASQLGRTGATGTAAAGGFGGVGGGLGGGGGLGATTALAAEELGGPESLVIGKTLIIADSQANTLIVSGPPENLRIITELLDELDQRSSQIYLSTVIGQLTLGDNFDWNLSLLRTVDNLDNTEVGGLYRTGSGENLANILDPSDLVAVDTFPVLSGLSVYGKIGQNLNVFIRALEATNRFTVLSRPSIFVRNNKKASIRSGQRIAVPTSTLTSLDTGVATPSVQASIQFEEVVLELEVVPLINSDNEVTLQIVQVNDNVIGTDIVGGNEVPIISTQVLETEVTIPDRSTVVLGGLISESVDDAKTGLPFLVHVPILKHVFGSTNKAKDRSELLIFIQPNIVNGAADLVDANVDLTRRAEVTQAALEFGITEPPVKPDEVREDVAEEEAAMNRAWQEELARRQAEEAAAAAAAAKKGGIFKGRPDKKNAAPAKGRPF